MLYANAKLGWIHFNQKKLDGILKPEVFDPELDKMYEQYVAMETLKKINF